MKRLLTLIVILLWQGCMFSVWARMGSWRLHMAYHNATQCVVVNDKVYVLSDGSLYSYTPDTEFIECYDKSNAISDQGIRHIGVCEKSNTLVIIYEDANIDLIHPDGSIVNITDFANASTFDPQVNDLRIVDGKAYMATNFGVIVLDIEREEFGDTYVLGKVTHSCIELGGVIYAATEGGLYCGDMSMNLLDISNWKLLSSNAYTQVAVFDNSLLALKSKESVYTVNVVDGAPTLFCKGKFAFLHCTDGMLLIGDNTNVFAYSSLADYTQLTFDEGTVNYLAADNGTFWTCNGAKGLNGYRYDEEGKCVVQTMSGIIPNSPVRNYCQYLSFVDDNRLLIAGGYINYFDYQHLHRPATLMIYEDEEWTSFEEEGVSNRIAGAFRNMTSIVQDPKDPNHHYASSFGQGIYEFRDLKFVRQYTHEDKPGSPDVVASPLESAVPYNKDGSPNYGYTRISRLLYDKWGNLWISNADGGNEVTCPLKILKPDGTFVSLYYEELKYLPTVTEVLFDSRDRVWVVSMQNEVRLFCIDLNGTLEDTSDDRVKMFNGKIVDQDGGSVEVYYINDIAEDQNGDIWVMTDKGPYVLYNTENVFSDNYRFTKIKVPRNDGTNFADYLLDGAYTTCIEIDPANRKWIGTLNNGLYLISADGLEEVSHFTKDNSPLPSNVIESLAMHHKSGELFIGTDKGLASYVTDASRPEESYDEEKVYAYPNPVPADYDGLITVVGLKANTHVKIINTAGRLVAEGTSLGGTFTWDGRTPQRQRVATGIYYVLGTDEEGREGIVTKVLFIK